VSFDAEERAVLARLADVLIPAGDGCPSASDAGVAGEGLDRLLSFRPDMADGLERLIVAARRCPAAAFVAELQSSDPAGFALLCEFVPGAYFLNPRVREALGYTGQHARAIDPQPDHLADLLQPVIKRGPIHRPTPSSTEGFTSMAPTPDSPQPQPGPTPESPGPTIPPPDPQPVPAPTPHPNPGSNPQT
jgi:hypothetical protein